VSATSLFTSTAEAIGALATPVGGGIFAYVKWRKNAERERRAREEAAKIAAERAAADVRAEEKALRDQVATLQSANIDSYRRRAELAEKKAELAEKKIENLNAEIMRLLTEKHRNGG
jgi:hypothetical protein